MYAVTLLIVFCCFQRCKNTKVNCVDGECTVICSDAWTCLDFQVDVSYGANLILKASVPKACYNVDINKYSGNYEVDPFVGMCSAMSCLYSLVMIEQHWSDVDCDGAEACEQMDITVLQSNSRPAVCMWFVFCHCSSVLSVACIINMNYCGTALKCKGGEGACTDMNIDARYANFKYKCSEESFCKNVIVLDDDGDENTWFDPANYDYWGQDMSLEDDHDNDEIFASWKAWKRWDLYSVKCLKTLNFCEMLFFCKCLKMSFCEC